MAGFAVVWHSHHIPPQLSGLNTDTPNMHPATPKLFLPALLVSALACSAACGPSAAEVRKARTAVYQCDEGTVTARILSELKARTGRAEGQPGGVILSNYRWHSSTGTPHQKNTARVGPGDLAIGYIVTYHKREHGWLVRAKADVISHVVGSPRGRALSPGDADYPDWAKDKVDGLLVAIHGKLKGECMSVDYLQ